MLSLLYLVNWIAGRQFENVYGFGVYTTWDNAIRFLFVATVIAVDILYISGIKNN